MPSKEPVVFEPDWQLVVDANAQLGETPMWSATHDALFWIDILGRTLNRSSVSDGKTSTWDLPELIGSYCLRADECGAIVALSTGIYNLSLDTGGLDLMYEAPYDQTRIRFNDGRCDKLGRFWVSTVPLTYAEKPDEPGSYWRLDKKGLSRQFDGLPVGNGTAFNADNSIMY